MCSIQAEPSCSLQNEETAPDLLLAFHAIYFRFHIIVKRGLIIVKVSCFYLLAIHQQVPFSRPTRCKLYVHVRRRDASQTAQSLRARVRLVWPFDACAGGRWCVVLAQFP